LFQYQYTVSLSFGANSKNNLVSSTRLFAISFVNCICPSSQQNFSKLGQHLPIKLDKLLIGLSKRVTVRCFNPISGLISSRFRSSNKRCQLSRRCVKVGAKPLAYSQNLQGQRDVLFSIQFVTALQSHLSPSLKSLTPRRKRLVVDY